MKLTKIKVGTFFVVPGFWARFFSRKIEPQPVFYRGPDGVMQVDFAKKEFVEPADKKKVGGNPRVVPLKIEIPELALTDVDLYG